MSNGDFKKKLLPAVFGAAVFLATLAAFSGALQNDFVPWDDDIYVYKNKVIRSLSPADAWNIFAGMQEFNYWHPAAWLSHALDYKFYKLDPGGYHLTSVLFHAMTTVAVYFLFCALVRAARPECRMSLNLMIAAAFAALVYGLHPLRVESAVWISERKEVMSGFFFFSGLLAYLHYVLAETKRRRILFYAGTILLFCLGLISKPHVVTFPVVLLLLDWYPLKRLGVPAKRLTVLLEKIPFFALSLAFSAGTLFLVKSGISKESLEEFPMGQRLWNTVRGLSFYLEKTLWPFPLIPYYPIEESPSVVSVPFIFSAALLLGISYISVKLWRKGKPVYLAAWVFYLITIFPAVGLVKVGAQAAADRFTYNTTTGFYLLLGLGMFWVLEQKPGSRFPKPFKRGVVVCAILLLAGLSFLTHRQIGVWKNGETLWTFVLKHFPQRLPFAYNNLGGYYHEEGQYGLAEPQFNNAINLRPDYPGAFYNLGLNFFKQDKFKQAILKFQRVVKLDPEHFEAINKIGMSYSELGQEDKAIGQFIRALEISPDYVPGLNNLGLSYYHTDRFEEAEEEMLKALRHDPDYPQANNNLGLLYRKTGRLDEAEKMFNIVLDLEPDQGAAIYNLGLVYRDRGDSKAAEKYFLKSLEIDPNRVAARNDLAILMLNDGHLNEAEKQLLLALQTQPDFFDGLNNLGVVYLKGAQFKKAEEQFSHAIKLNPQNKVARSNLENARRQLRRSVETEYFSSPSHYNIPADQF